MAEAAERHETTRKPVLYRLRGMKTAPVRRGIIYRTTASQALTLDLYSPRKTTMRARRPAVVFVIGYADAGARQRLGCAFKDMECYINWAQLAAASGLVGVTYENEDPAADVHAVLAYLHEHAAELGIDAERIGIWACSGNAPVALSTLLRDARTKVACAAFCYSLMLDVRGTQFVADAANVFGFANPCAGKTVADLAPETPIFIARAGKDAVAHLNDTIDAFVAAALEQNQPIALVNYDEGVHSFDLEQDTEMTRETIARILAFFRFNLLGATSPTEVR